MQTMIDTYQISISTDADSDAFEEFMKAEVFPTAKIGRQTRGGIVTVQYLLKSESTGSGRNYSWIVRWETGGGSPFGTANAPLDPAPHLTAFGAKTSFIRYTLKAEDLQ